MNLLADWFLTLLFPHKCFLCGRTLPGTGWTCPSCVLPEVHDGELCLRCGKKKSECFCEGRSFAYDGAFSPLHYTREVARGIHHYKYDGRTYYADFLAPLMARGVERAFSGIRFDEIAYVPSSRKKQRQRGFCQTELLAKRIATQMNLPIQRDALKNTGQGTAQVDQKSPAARAQNAANSFSAKEGVRVNGRCILLVDDVLTTGATADRCAQILKELGASRVYVITAATTDRRKKEKQNV